MLDAPAVIKFSREHVQNFTFYILLQKTNFAIFEFVLYYSKPAEEKIKERARARKLAEKQKYSVARMENFPIQIATTIIMQ